MVTSLVWGKRALAALLLGTGLAQAASVETEAELPAAPPTVVVVPTGPQSQIGQDLLGWGGETGALQGSDSLFLPIGSQIGAMPSTGLFDQGSVATPAIGAEVP